jgi:mannosyltransferase
VTTTQRAVRPLDVIFVVTLIVIGTGLRFYRIDTGLWFDEILTLLDSVRSPLTRILTHFPGNNDHPLYSVLAHLSVSRFGESPWALRLPSALFGVATIPLLYAVGLAISDRREAAAAATILTVSYHHVWFSQNARGYTALLFCVLLATYVLIRWLDTGRRGFLVSYAVVTAVGSYAQPCACACDRMAREHLRSTAANAVAGPGRRVRGSRSAHGLLLRADGR